MPDVISKKKEKKLLKVIMFNYFCKYQVTVQGLLKK